MAGKISSFPAGVQTDTQVRGASSISTNTRVRTALGYVAVVTDTVVFPGGTGLWFLANQRVRVNNMPTIGSSSVGISVISQVPGTMTVVQADTRAKGM